MQLHRRERESVLTAIDCLSTAIEDHNLLADGADGQNVDQSSQASLDGSNSQSAQAPETSGTSALH